jgi:hypothetical protein
MRAGGLRGLLMVRGAVSSEDEDSTLRSAGRVDCATTGEKLPGALV